MSKLPDELRELFAETRRVHEPDPARLNAVYQRVLSTPPAASAFDVPPPSLRLATPWGWLAVGGALVIGAALWLATPAPPSPIARPEPRVAEPTPPPTPVAEPRVIPSSDWPVIAEEKLASKRVRRARRAEVVEEAEQSVPVTPTPEPPAAPILEPVPEALERAETPSEYPTGTRTVGSRQGKADAAASLRDEVRLITRARQAIERGDWQAAQHALDAYQLEHPAGQLHAEQRALLARARCLADDLASARRLHAELRLLAPGSSLLRGVERACPALLR